MNDSLTAGIDLGYGSAKAVVIQHERIIDRIIERIFYEKGDAGTMLGTITADITEKYPALESIGITGGKSAQAEVRGIALIDEIKAIGAGACFLADADSCIAVSCGTGTCIVHAAPDKTCAHISGTGLGGGTILGLSKMLLGTDNPAIISSLAEKGIYTNVDLLVRDIVGSGIGNVPADATASHFAKLSSAGKNAGKGDVARAILHLVGENIGIIACLAARAAGNQSPESPLLVFTGRTVLFDQVRRDIDRVCSLYKIKSVFPEYAEFATAAGAALLAKGMGRMERMGRMETMGREKEVGERRERETLMAGRE